MHYFTTVRLSLKSSLALLCNYNNWSVLKKSSPDFQEMYYIYNKCTVNRIKHTPYSPYGLVAFFYSFFFLYSWCRYCVYVLLSSFWLSLLGSSFRPVATGSVAVHWRFWWLPCLPSAFWSRVPSCSPQNSALWETSAVAVCWGVFLFEKWLLNIGKVVWSTEVQKTRSARETEHLKKRRLVTGWCV